MQFTHANGVTTRSSAVCLDSTECAGTATVVPATCTGTATGTTTVVCTGNATVSPGIYVDCSVQYDLNGTCLAGCNRTEAMVPGPVCGFSSDAERYVNVCNEVRCGSSDCNEDSYCAPRDELHEVACCSDVNLGGWRSCSVGGAPVYGERDAGSLSCTSSATLVEALDTCAGVGARLCTAAELEAGCTSSTGCSFDFQLLWSSTSVVQPGLQNLSATACPGGCVHTPAHVPTCDRSASTDGSDICPAGCEATVTGSLPTTFVEAAAVCAGTDARLCTIDELLQGVAHDTGSWELQCQDIVLELDPEDQLMCSQCDAGLSFIMYSLGSVHSRSGFETRFNDPDHFAIVRWNSDLDDEGWQADSVAGWTGFNVLDGDVLVAELVGNSSVAPILDQLDLHHGIRRGFDGGDLAFTPHTDRQGRESVRLHGTSLRRACCASDTIETWSATPCGTGGYKVAIGTDGSGRAECRHNLNDSLPVRCCADVVVPECGPSVGPLFSCQLCAVGTEQLVAGTDTIESCFDCTPGRADLDRDPSTECELCPLGLFSQGFGSSSCGPCGAGTYTDPTATACLPGVDCPPGTFVDNDHQACTRCSQGRYSTESGSAGCKACPPSTANNRTGSISQEDCALCPDGFGAPCLLLSTAA
eukprot:COSAG06_NODE_547_length_14431_cov_5.614746_2_plen_643_part_00